jgi:hypothetical protein
MTHSEIFPVGSRGNVKTEETLDDVKSRAYLVWAEWGPDRAFPFMTDEAIQKAWFLANYYAWHDGY